MISIDEIEAAFVEMKEYCTENWTNLTYSEDICPGCPYKRLCHACFLRIPMSWDEIGGGQDDL